MRRGAYVGDLAARGAGYPSIPMQNETLAYFARFSTPPSTTYRTALNEAIFRWKAAGVYSLLQDLWLFCADTTADARRNLISAARDATLVGAPTFTARSGYSGFNSSNYVSMPFSSTGVTTNSGFYFAGKAAPNLANNTMLVGSSGATGAVMMVSPAANLAGVTMNNGGAPPIIAFNVLGLMWWVLGQASGHPIVGCTDSAGLNNTGVVTTSPAKCDNGNLGVLLAYGVMPTATSTQGRKFISILQSLFDDIGALI